MYVYSDPERENEEHALPDVETFYVGAKDTVDCGSCASEREESVADFKRSYARNMEGLQSVSTGFMPECSECLSNHGYRDEENDDGDVVRTAEEVARAEYDAGRISDGGWSFSWRDCDVCGSSLGGDREPAHGISDRDGKIVHLDVCTDCVMYTANGEAPESWEDEPDHGAHVGWYWQSCFPGCLPDGDPFGPFATEDEAIADARSGGAE